MNAETRRAVEMGVRAVDFSSAHPDTDPGYVRTEEKLKGLVAHALALATTQREGLVDVHSAAAQKRELRRAMQVPIAHLAEVGRFASREDHELGKTFTFKPPADTYLAFRTTAGSMAAAAQARKEVLAQHGLSQSVLDGFVQTLGEFDAAVKLGNDGRTAHTGASAELLNVAREITRTVRVMDGRNRQRFQSDGQLLGSWINARTVLGRPKNGTAVPSGEDSGTPTPLAGDVRPAA